ncbi:MAG: rRNA maturation RNase YbeY [Planctomycetota bacterium]|jgi:probable rRNA maturation factor
MIAVHITKKFKNIDISRPKLKNLVKATCKHFAKHQAPNLKYEISIAIVDRKEMLQINKHFLNRTTDTDVISFDLSDNQKTTGKKKKQKFLELVVNGEKAVKEAQKRAHSSQAELALYITHGLLHHLGFDDSQPENAKKMHDAEDEILQQQGFGVVYNA